MSNIDPRTTEVLQQQSTSTAIMPLPQTPDEKPSEEPSECSAMSASRLSSAHQQTVAPILFRKSDYNTFDTGRTLNPVEHGFENQEEISIHLQTLARMVRTELQRIKDTLPTEQERFNTLELCIDLVIQLRRDSVDCDERSFELPFEGSCGKGETYRRTILQMYATFGVKQLELARVILNTSNECVIATHLSSMRENAVKYNDATYWPLKYVNNEEHTQKDPVHNRVFDQQFLAEHKMVGRTWGEVSDTLILVQDKLQNWRRESYQKIGTSRQDLNILKKEEKRCIPASKFAKGLAILRGPFNFFGLPRELRDRVYIDILHCDFNITVTQLTTLPRGPAAFKAERAKIWTHPIFQTSRKLRKEAGEEFYGHNSFVCRSFATLPSDLGQKVLAQSFLRNIKNLAITWQSLDSASIVAAKVLRSFKGLKHIDICLNWEKLSQCPGNNLGGVSAFQSLIELPNPKLPCLERVQIFNIPLRSAERELLQIILNSDEADALDNQVSQSWDELESQPAPRLKTKVGAKYQELCFDTGLTTRILGAQNPFTVYNHGRQPQKPPTLWPKARHDGKKPRIRTRVAALVENIEVQEKLDEIKVIVATRRKQRLSLIADEKVRLLAEKVRLCENALHLQALPFYGDDMSILWGSWEI